MPTSRVIKTSLYGGCCDKLIGGKHALMQWEVLLSAGHPVRMCYGSEEKSAGRPHCEVLRSWGDGSKASNFVDLFSWVRTGLICLFRMGEWKSMDIACHILYYLLLFCVRDCIHAKFSSVHLPVSVVFSNMCVESLIIVGNAGYSLLTSWMMSYCADQDLGFQKKNSTIPISHFHDLDCRPSKTMI